MTSEAQTTRRVALVVEDDPLLRMHTVDIVEDAGFTVIEAKDADAAIVLLETRADIVLLVTDIQMPGSMDGLKLARAVRDRWPPIKIVIVSGQVDLTENDLPPESRFFAKPFHAERMIKELRELLG